MFGKNMFLWGLFNQHGSLVVERSLRVLKVSGSIPGEVKQTKDFKLVVEAHMPDI